MTLLDRQNSKINQPMGIKIIYSLLLLSFPYPLRVAPFSLIPSSICIKTPKLNMELPFMLSTALCSRFWYFIYTEQKTPSNAQETPIPATNPNL